MNQDFRKGEKKIYLKDDHDRLMGEKRGGYHVITSWMIEWHLAAFKSVLRSVTFESLTRESIILSNEQRPKRSEKTVKDVRGRDVGRERVKTKEKLDSSPCVG